MTAPLPRHSAPGRRSVLRRHGARGQSLVEFALVFPIFLTLALGLVEFSLLFNGILSIDYASRDAALLASEAGNAAGGDCVVLAAVETAVGAPADRSRIQTVAIFQADANGNAIGGTTTYVRGGSKTCVFADGTSQTVPYTLSADGYPEASRCNIIAGCGSGHPSLDVVGVRVTYSHIFKTPIRSFLGGGTLTISRANAMRMEPVL